MISKTISVCSAKDLSTWLVASKYIVENINSNEYIVVVPEVDVDIFKKYSPSKYQIINESILIGSLSVDLKLKFNSDNLYRYGWYLQQFIKLAALSMAQDNELFVIWDADTIPLKKINFTANGKVGYYYGIENHAPYFDLIYSMTGLAKIVNHSFIAQCFAIKGAWFKEFVEYLERRHNLSWTDVLMGYINFHEPSGFSEYETLGTFLTHTHINDIYLIPNKWMRRGNSLIGNVSNLETKTSQFLLKPYDFVSFEGWDRPTVTTRLNATLSFLKDFLI